MMDIEPLKRAAWVQNSPNTWILKCRVRDGGAVLATISGGRFVSTGYTWQVSDQSGSHTSLYGAQRAARKVLREEAAASQEGIQRPSGAL